MKFPPSAWPSSLFCFLVGCGEVVTPTDFAQFSASDNVDRVLSHVTFDTLWVLGGTVSDTLLAAPTFPRAYGDGGLVFFDLQHQVVHRVDPHGRVLWSWGSKGEGPGELQNVRALDVDSFGNVVLVDSERLVLIMLTPDGDFIDEKPISRNGGLIRSASVLRDGEIAVHTTRVPWGSWTGKSIHPVMNIPSGWSEMPSLQNQGRIVSWQNGWVFGFSVGNGWMVIRDDKVDGVYPYVHHYDFPEIVIERRGLSRNMRMTSRPTTTGRSLSVRGDTLYVLFGGSGPRRGFMLDTFDLATGQYIATHLLPHYANRAVVDESGRVFTVNNSSLFPTVVGLMPIHVSNNSTEEQ